MSLKTISATTASAIRCLDFGRLVGAVPVDLLVVAAVAMDGAFVMAAIGVGRTSYRRMPTRSLPQHRGRAEVQAAHIRPLASADPTPYAMVSRSPAPRTGCSTVACSLSTTITPS